MNIGAQLISFCIAFFRPLLGPAFCKFSISCTEFAHLQLRTKPLHTAVFAIIKRVLSCNPFW